MPKSPPSPINLTPNGGEPTDLGLLPKPATVYSSPTVILGGTGELATRRARVKSRGREERKEERVKEEKILWTSFLDIMKSLDFLCCTKEPHKPNN
jgi:hypothetical protein